MKLLRFSFPYLCKLSKNCIILKCKRYSYSTSRNIWKHPISLITPWQCTFISSCKFHASLSKNAKHFQERENEYAHEVMVNLPVYSNTLLRYPLQISCLKQSDIHRNVFDNFVNATACNIHKGSSLENLEYCNLVKNICTSLSQASDDEIQNTLLCLCMWPPTPHTTTRNFKLLWNALDGECTKRLKNWDENFSRYFSSMASDNSKQMIFVYGTLKKGEPNHDLIEQRNEGKAIFLGKASTVKAWPLVIASRYNIPYLLYCEGKGTHVIGELYEVDDVMLAKMDELECHPDYYTRVKEDVYIISENDTKEIVKPWIYFLKNFRSELLKLNFLSDYSAKGSHGLEYVSRYCRPEGQKYYSDVMNV